MISPPWCVFIINLKKLGSEIEKMTAPFWIHLSKFSAPWCWVWERLDLNTVTPVSENEPIGSGRKSNDKLSRCCCKITFHCSEVCFKIMYIRKNIQAEMNFIDLFDLWQAGLSVAVRKLMRLKGPVRSFSHKLFLLLLLLEYHHHWKHHHNVLIMFDKPKPTDCGNVR